MAGENGEEKRNIHDPQIQTQFTHPASVGQHSAFILTACNGTDEDAQIEEAIALVYTSAAQTMAAQPTEPLPTSTPYATTATLLPTQTLIAQALTQPSPTLAQVVQQSICNEALYMSDVTIPEVQF